MNCTELAKSIRELEEARDRLQDRKDYSNNTGLGKIELKKELNTCTELEDQMLETYLDDFKKIYSNLLLNNQELDDWKNDWKTVGEIKDFCTDQISPIVPLPDGSLIIKKTGDIDEWVVIREDEENGWGIYDKIDGVSKTDYKMFPGRVLDYKMLPDGRVLLEDVAKGKGIVVLDNKDGKWTAQGEINPSGRRIETAIPLPDGNVALRMNGKLVIFKEKNGEWEDSKKEIPLSLARTATPLPDGRVMMESGSRLAILEKQDEEWKVGSDIEGFQFIESIAMLPDGNVLVNDSNYALVLVKNEDGHWRKDKTILNVKNLPGMSGLVSYSPERTITNAKTFMKEKVLVTQFIMNKLSSYHVFGKNNGEWVEEKEIHVHSTGIRAVPGRNIFCNYKNKTLTPIIQTDGQLIRQIKIEELSTIQKVIPLKNGELFVIGRTESGEDCAIVLARIVTIDNIKQNLDAIIRSEP